MEHEEREHKPGDQLDYNYIDQGIYLGTNQCCALGLAEVLEKEGITSDISLEDTRIDHPYGVDLYTWIPTPDHTAPSPTQISFGVKALAELVQQGRKVYVHCKNGHGRSPTLVAAYLVSARSMGADEAVAYLKERRPSMHLEQSQLEALRALAREKGISEREGGV